MHGKIVLVPIPLEVWRINCDISGISRRGFSLLILDVSTYASVNAAGTNTNAWLNTDVKVIYGGTETSENCHPLYFFALETTIQIDWMPNNVEDGRKHSRI
ncbi:hypothetical protein CDAR_283271 [Caerostris darwini]|uniref:Uncharacterized protein n=1 Tax=Caerostris darwini TaxID=1538125 RepID=A0AAV4THF1_9ARAC|nr:hypothetical protein CDAR_283271 [Caerostris darwini]